MKDHTLTPIEQRSWPRRLLNRLEVDRAVFYALAARGWQFIAGPVTMALIVWFFDIEAQAFYYTFGSLLALQLFVELGLHVALINVASHEWAQLSIDEHGAVRGEPLALSRLIGLGRFAMKWYLAAAVLFVVIIGSAGFIFLRQLPVQTVQWAAPWIALVFLTGLQLPLLPLTAILEGCNQMAAIHRTRFFQAMTGTAVVWISICFGAQLWAVVASAFVRLLWETHLVFRTYGHFFRPFLVRPSSITLDWRTEVWPLQWRLAVQGTIAWFAFHSLVPVMLQFHGPTVAARLGMTWTVLMAMQAGALAWVEIRRPLFGTLIAEKNFAELNRVFNRLTLISFCMLFAAGSVFVTAVVLLNWVDAWPLSRLAERLLPPSQAIVFTLLILILHVPKCQNIYVRAHKQDPFLLPSTLVNSLIGVLIIVLGSRFGPIGAGVGYLVVVAGLQAPLWWWIWRRCKTESQTV